MLLRVISILTVCLFSSSIGNAAIVNSNNISTIVGENTETASTKEPEVTTNSKREFQGLIINNDRLSLSPTLQTELASEITKAQKCLMKLEDFLSKKTEAKIGLVYMHLGYENWSLRFTYGGYLLNTEEIIINTTDIFELKQIFANTKSLQITSNNYQTTRYINQLGPILHESQP